MFLLRNWLFKDAAPLSFQLYVLVRGLLLPMHNENDSPIAKALNGPTSPSRGLNRLGLDGQVQTSSPGSGGDLLGALDIVSKHRREETLALTLTLSYLKYASDLQYILLFKLHHRNI